LSSSRRVKKGPGRRPQSAKRQRFVELRERGWSILAAAGEVGVSRTTGNNWSRGYKTYRLGQVVGFVPGLERLAVRHISRRFLSQEERIEIAELRHVGLSIRQIAHRLGSGTLDGVAGAAPQRDRESGLPSLRCTPARDRASRPQSSATHRGQRRTEAVGRRASGPTVEPTADQSSLAVEVPRAVGDVAVSREHLPGPLPGGIDTAAAIAVGSAPSLTAAHRRNHRRAHQRTERRRPRFEHPMLAIHQRPFPPEDRSQPGHWESQCCCQAA
jgi:IS30 family transposase